MPVWFSPFDLQPTLEHRLESCGWQRCEQIENLPADGLLLYAPPDQLLNHTTLDPRAILEGYQHLLSLEHPYRLLSGWRIQACCDELLQASLELGQDETGRPDLTCFPAPDPLAAVITRLALDTLPDLLEAYLDLELETDLLGGDPDTHYRQRVLTELNIDELLQAWRQPSAWLQQLEQAQQTTAEAREEAELTLLQLHQVQEELEEHFLRSTEQSRQLEELNQKHKQILEERNQAQQMCADQSRKLEEQAKEHQQLRENLEKAQQATRDAQEEAELTLLQLHQVQEELEHYFLLSRGQSGQLERYAALLRRSESLLSSVGR